MSAVEQVAMHSRRRGSMHSRLRSVGTLLCPALGSELPSYIQSSGHNVDIWASESG